MKAFYDTATAHGATRRPVAAEHPLAEAHPKPARIAVYDGLAAPPRVEEVSGSDARDLIEALATRVYQVSHEAGGSIPYTVLREVVENLIHAEFDEVVVTVLDGGNTVRFADQGPGIPDKERAFSPGFSTANTEMKRVIKGVGSGLPVARECLVFSGGTIEIDDNLGSGTVVTLRMAEESCDDGNQAPEPSAPETPVPAVPLTLRQKQVLSLLMELGAAGPTVVSRELGIGLSTAYRDLAGLETLGLIDSDLSGKRVLTAPGVSQLDSLFSR